MNIVVQQLSGADPLVERLAKPAIDRMKYPSTYRNGEPNDHIRALVAAELQDKVKPLETIESPIAMRLTDDSGAKPGSELAK